MTTLQHSTHRDRVGIDVLTLHSVDTNTSPQPVKHNLYKKGSITDELNTLHNAVDDLSCVNEFTNDPFSE